MLRLGPYPPPLIEISDPEELWTEKAEGVPLLASELDVSTVFPEDLVEVLEAKPGSVQEHINAVLGFNTCRKLQAHTEGVFFEETEQREDLRLRERAGEALRAAAARRAEEKYALAPTLHSASVTTGTPSSSQSEVGSNGEEEVWDERRRPRREVQEESWKEEWSPLTAPPGHFEPVHPKAEYFQEQQMYDQYLELQRYHQVLEKQQRDLQRMLQAYAATGFADQNLMSQYQLAQLNLYQEQRGQVLGQYNYLESTSSSAAYTSAVQSHDVQAWPLRQWEKPCSFVDGKVLGTTPSTAPAFG